MILYLYIDTEFLEMIFKPNIHKDNPIINYHYMKPNVDALQIIQFGLSLSNARGNLLDFDSPFSYVWEFNFRDFGINRDRYASDSIELLKCQGISFGKNKEKGIDSKDFAKKFWDYGLLFNCYGLKNSYSRSTAFVSSLVRASIGLFLWLQHFRPQTHLNLLGLLGGLEKIAQTLNMARITGSSHQARLKSLLTFRCFMKLKSENVFESKWNETNQMLLPPLILYRLAQT
ncbi:putative CCR4-associated factor 1-like protein 11 isoform X1 [Gossypium australe]|uniref:Putative CCR4-associated factor 1-like protein 11 isoform X1 n=1 Tax=Gossypium australe TaxID=47621 RepID=A0A5B6VTU6_9ROSI|nr:putative CCR4-associated factor 1-like protein 11 isoform X1 [Gossypium australe]